MFDNMRWDQRIGTVFSLSKDVTITGRVVVTGDVTLILPEGKTLTASSGITVKEGNKLTIEGSGKLNATGLTYQAGIGGGYGCSGGNVIINGGTVTAASGGSANGIGMGNSGKSCGKLTIGYVELQESDLAINSGWYLYYGNSQNIDLIWA